MRLDASIWAEIHSCLPQLYRQVRPEAQAEEMLRIILRFVRVGSAVINRLEVESGAYTVTGLPAEIFTDERIRETGKYLHESPFPAYHMATGDMGWKMTTDFMTLEDFHKTGLYRSMRCWDAEAQMCAMLALVDGVAYAITLQSRRNFTEHERAVLNALHPHFVTSFMNAMCFEKAALSQEHLRGLMDQAPGAYGYLDRDGCIGWLQPRAKEWLDGFFPQTGDQDRLPTDIFRLMRELSGDQTDVGHLTRSRGQERLLVFLLASPMGGWFLRLERQQLAPSPSPYRALPMLTRRQNAVLTWMVEGKRNSEIAKILELSERTVEKHVSAILARLGVENRATGIVRAMEHFAAIGDAPRG